MNDFHSEICFVEEPVRHCLIISTSNYVCETNIVFAFVLKYENDMRQVEDYRSLKFLILALCFLKTHSLSLPTVAEIVRQQNLVKLSK